MKKYKIYKNELIINYLYCIIIQLDEKLSINNRLDILNF